MELDFCANSHKLSNGEIVVCFLSPNHEGAHSCGYAIWELTLREVN